MYTCVLKQANPRKIDQAMAATSPFFARLTAIEQHWSEASGLPGFAISVLTAIQANVPQQEVSLWATAYFIFRLGWYVTYLPAIPSVMGPLATPVAYVRTVFFLLAILVLGNLFALTLAQIAA